MSNRQSGGPEPSVCSCVQSINQKPIEGYIPEADLGLSCGLPTERLAIPPGSTVVDLGCGAGRDVFIASQRGGPNGPVVGVDFDPKILAQAKKSAKRHNREDVH